MAEGNLDREREAISSKLTSGLDPNLDGRPVVRGILVGATGPDGPSYGTPSAARYTASGLYVLESFPRRCDLEGRPQGRLPEKAADATASKGINLFHGVPHREEDAGRGPILHGHGQLQDNQLNVRRGRGDPGTHEAANGRPEDAGQAGAEIFSHIQGRLDCTGNSTMQQNQIR